MYRQINVMGCRVSGSKCLGLCLLLTLVMGCYLAALPIQYEREALPNPVRQRISLREPAKKRLAILVPFRDRFEELLDFVPHMYKFLNKQKIPFHIFIVQQKDNNRFNRASLINAGFIYSQKDFDYIAMHDVDLLPLNDNLKYDYPSLGPVHISSPQTHPKYHYETFIGGILLINKEHYQLVNGMSNNYWGWGLEDDEFYVRLKDAKLSVIQLSNITTGTAGTFRHSHDKAYRKRDMRKCFNQREVTRKRDRKTGLHDVQYNLLSVHNVSVDGLALTVLNVELKCDKTRTPWCQCPDPVKTSASQRRDLVVGLGVDTLWLETMLQAMVSSGSRWNAAVSFCEQVMLVKEPAEREREGTLPAEFRSQWRGRRRLIYAQDHRPPRT